MATAALIPVTEYLATTYRPDRDYIDHSLLSSLQGICGLDQHQSSS